MDGKHRTTHATQVIVQIPAGKVRRQPRVDPGAEHPGRFVAVIPAQAIELAWLREHLLRIAYSLDRAVFDERLSRFRYQGAAISRLSRGAGDRHSATDAVPEGDKTFDRQLFPRGTETSLGFVTHEAAVQPVRMRVRSAESKAVVGEDLPPGRKRQLRRKIAPQFHTTKRIVEQHDGGVTARGRRKAPALGEDSAVSRGYPGFAGQDGRHRGCVSKPIAVRDINVSGLAPNESHRDPSEAR